MFVCVCGGGRGGGGHLEQHPCAPLGIELGLFVRHARPGGVGEEGAPEHVALGHVKLLLSACGFEILKQK